MIVSNTSPIIVLGKQGVLELLKNCFGKVIIPQEVYNEIIKKEDSLETISLKKGIEEKWIIIEETAINPIINTDNLGKGEKEAVSLAAKKKSILLIDDDNARKYASLLRVECRGTIYVLFLAVLKKIMDKIEAKEIFDNIVIEGFYVSTEVYSGFLSMLERL
ncbi:MAG: DUF3368 domain-containing protein [Candidatus Pacearchaeota archaeon]|nr:DUF3368 domain-containing protein [Candidatus Pacearchaeota archaeon]